MNTRDYSSNLNIVGMSMSDIDKLNKSRVEPGKIEVNKKRVNRAEIPTSFHNTSLKEIDDNEVNKKVNMYVNNLWKAYNRGVGLIFYGPPLTGKSSLASIVLKNAIEWGFTSLFKDADSIIQSTINDDEFSDGELYKKRFLKVDFLVIDDIQPSKNENRFSMIYNVIKKRSDWTLPTILTTSIPIDYLNQYFPLGFREVSDTYFESIIVESDKFKKKYNKIRESIFGKYDK